MLFRRTTDFFRNSLGKNIKDSRYNTADSESNLNPSVCPEKFISGLYQSRIFIVRKHRANMISEFESMYEIIFRIVIFHLYFAKFIYPE